MATTPANSIQGPQLGINDLLNILITQLRFQDPLKPVDNEAFIAQLAQFSALEQTQELNTRIDTLNATQSTLQSVGLLGRTIDIASASGQITTGTVISVALASGTPQLTISSQPGNVQVTGITIDQITRVQ